MTKREKIICVVLGIALIGALWFTQAPECRTFGHVPAHCVD